MRKRLIPTDAKPAASPAGDWLDLDQLATVEVTSEEPAHPIEAALLPESDAGWQAAEPGLQLIRILFDQPQQLRRIWLHFTEPTTHRTQEFVLRWSKAKLQPLQEIVRQQWNFSPSAASEVEDYRVDLADVMVLELAIMPDIGGGQARATLRQMRLA